MRRGGPTAEAAGRDWRGQYAAVTPASVSPLVAARRARALAGVRLDRSHLPKIKTTPVYIG